MTTYCFKKLLQRMKAWCPFKWFKWNNFLKIDENPKPFAEISIYLLIFIFGLWLYVRWNSVPYMEEYIEVEMLNKDVKTVIPVLDIKFCLPMTTKEQLYKSINEEGLILKTSNLEPYKYDSITISFYLKCDSIRNIDNNLRDIRINGQVPIVFSDDVHCLNVRFRSSGYNKRLKSQFDSLVNIRNPINLSNPFYYQCQQSIHNHLFNNYSRLEFEDCKNDSVFFHQWKIYKENNFIIEEGFCSGSFNKTIQIKDRRHLALGDPGWITMEDISQSYYDIHIITPDIDAITLEFDFVGAAEFTHIFPEPDTITMSGIKYTNPFKLLIIKEKGLRFHVTFKELQNRQSMRVFALTAIMSSLLIIFISFMVIKLFKIINRKYSKESEIKLSDKYSNNE